MPKAKSKDEITDAEIRFASLLMSGSVTDKEAALAAGLNPASASFIKAKPRVRAHMAQHRAKVLDGLAQHEVNTLAELDISRETIIAKYWALASLPANAVNGSVIIRALENVWRALGFDEAKEEKELPKPDIYIAPWKREIDAAVKLGLEPDIFDRLRRFEEASPGVTREAKTYIS